MAHEYNDVILYIVSSPCSHALDKVARAALHTSWNFQLPKHGTDSENCSNVIRIFYPTLCILVI